MVVSRSEEQQPVFWPLLLDPAIRKAERGDDDLSVLMGSLRLADAAIGKYDDETPEKLGALTRRNQVEHNVIDYLTQSGISRTILRVEQ